VGREGIHLVSTAAMSVKLWQATEPRLKWGVDSSLMTASDCMGGKRGTPVSDCTLDLLIDHLRDLYLPTILARIADRSEPYANITKFRVAVSSPQ